jgi:glycosyltransferase involved in cell wall biosynthesis
MHAGNKTLIILTPGFPANETDSTCLPFPQLFVKTLSRVQPFLNVVVITFQYPFIRSDYTWNGVTVIALNGQNKGKINRLLIWKAVWKRLNNIVKENNVAGILNFWLGECGLIGKWAAGKHALPSFTWLLGQDAAKSNRYYPLIKPTSPSLVALSDFIAGEFYRNYNIMPAHVIAPGIDTAAFPEHAALRDIDILGAGSLIPLKRYDIFIRVVAQLAKKKPGIKTILCGKGNEQANLQRMIDEAGLSENITLCGELDHRALLAMMMRSKVFLHPSAYEGFATVFSEALYAGLHVVGFCQPMKTIFKNQYVVNSEEEMTEKVSELLSNGNLSHKSIITYPIEETCGRILSLYGI